MQQHRSFPLFLQRLTLAWLRYLSHRWEDWLFNVLGGQLSDPHLCSLREQLRYQIFRLGKCLPFPEIFPRSGGYGLCVYVWEPLFFTCSTPSSPLSPTVRLQWAHLHILISDIQVTEWWSFFLTSLVASATVQVYEYITTFDREVRILLLCELDLCWPVFSVTLFGQWNVVIPRSYT